MLEAIAVFTIVLGLMSNTSSFFLFFFFSFFDPACGWQKLAERIETIYFHTGDIFFATLSANSGSPHNDFVQRPDEAHGS
jgi:hypothetical protein